MRWAAAHSLLADAEGAAVEVASALRTALGGDPPDLVLAFFTAPHVPAAETIARTLKERLQPRCLAGASAASIVASHEEIESGAALSVIAGILPNVEVRPFILVSSVWGDAIDDPLEFARHTPGVEGAEVALLFGDPFSLDADRVLAAFNRHAPGLRIVGGMTSAGPRPQANALILNDWVSHEGGIGIALRGALQVDVVVSQGCRPIGPPLEVTKVEHNLIYELDGRPALERTEEILRELSEPEREYLRHGLYVGRPARGGATGRGDYLIRNLLGADREHGAIAVADRMAEHERVRLHVRDATTAIEDLELLLAPQEFDAKPAGAFLFSCNGRGRAFFGKPHQDVATLQSALGGEIPIAGMFCAGEIGPVGPRNFLHGHTVSIAVLRGRTSDHPRS
jgi:small ligand-binding sensory domain FIST